MGTEDVRASVGNGAWAEPGVVAVDETRIDALFAGLDSTHLPGVAVGIAVRGTPVYRKGFGLASMELPVALSPSIRMRIYSATKHFTCLAYLLLCEEGKASADASIGTLLPELHAVAHQVTVQQLMGHTSGLRDAHDINWHFSGMGHAVTSDEVLSLYRDIDDVEFAPGTGWSYNNGGYLLLTAAIERITGQPLESVFRERIFEPVGMRDTLLRRFDTDFVPNSATMHAGSAASGFEKRYMGTATAGEGGIASTVDDLLRWLAHMDSPRVGSRETWSLMRRPQTLANGTSTGYGLGLTLRSYRGVEIVYHSGAGSGANAILMKAPGAGLDVVILLNRWDVSAEELAYRVLDACLPNLAAVGQAASHRIPEGVFLSPKSGRVIQFSTAAASSAWVREGQTIASIDGGEIPLKSSDGHRFSPAGVYESLNLEIVPSGDANEVAKIRLLDFGNVDELRRIAAHEREDVHRITGRYRSEATGTDAVIVAGDVPTLRTTGRFGSAEFELESLGERVWQARAVGGAPWRAILLFDEDRAEFRFSSFRTRGQSFRRAGESQASCV